MSFQRGFLISALVIGGLVAAPSAAFASTVQPATGQQAAATISTAPSMTTAPGTVRRVPCTGLTFNVYHDHYPEPVCYAGTGAKTLDIKSVVRITTGEYWGCYTTRNRGIAFGSFHPGEPIPFPKPVELVSIELARHQVVCPL